jgi:protein-tyrosine phosphatase
LGKLGRKPMELGRAMLQAGMVHSIASDAHKTRGKRQPWLGQVWRWLQETVGPLVAAQIMVNNPAVMVGMEPPGEPAAAVSAGPGTGSMHSNGT